MPIDSLHHSVGLSDVKRDPGKGIFSMSFVSEASIPEVSWSFTEDTHRSIRNRIVDGEPQIGS